MKKSLFVFCVAVFLVACEYIVEIPDISDKTVTILAPAQNVVLDTLPVTFTWQHLEDSDQYHLQVATPNFTAAKQIVVDTMVNKTYFTQTLFTGNYEWHVIGINSGYQSLFSNQSFSLEK